MSRIDKYTDRRHLVKIRFEISHKYEGFKNVKYYLLSDIQLNIFIYENLHINKVLVCVLLPFARLTK